jgi:hypothetical protein
MLDPLLEESPEKMSSLVVERLLDGGSLDGSLAAGERGREWWLELQAHSGLQCIGRQHGRRLTSPPSSRDPPSKRLAGDALERGEGRQRGDEWDTE